MSDPKPTLTPYMPAVSRIAIRTGIRLFLEVATILALAAFGLWQWAWLILALSFFEHLASSLWAFHLYDLDDRERELVKERRDEFG